MIEEELGLLPCAADGRKATAHRLPNGSHLICIYGVKLPAGWNRAETDVLFVAPPGFPAAQPDCFWVTPSNFRLANGSTPQASNDANPIPGDDVPEPRPTTWFSWHLQSWNPNVDGLLRYFHMIERRLQDVR